MKLHRVFDDLGEFVAAFRGGISREAIRIDLDERHIPGTMLELDLALADGLSLVRGRAAVVDVRQAPSHAIASWRTVLRFSSLDPDSRDFLERLERRQEAEGEPVFRPDVGNPRAELEPTVDDAPNLTDTGALEVAFRDMSRRPTVRERAAPIEEQSRRGSGSRGRQGGGRVAAWLIAAFVIAAASVTVIWIVRPDLLRFESTDDSTSTTADVAVTDPTPAPPPPTVTAVPPTPTPVATPPPATRGALRATELAWSVENGVTVVRVTADRDLAPSAIGRFRMDDDPGPRELVVIRGVGASDLPVRRAVDSPHVASVRTWLHDDRSPPELHVVLDLSEPSASADEPIVEGRTVTVRIR
jgi:hypothetical protein